MQTQKIITRLDCKIRELNKMIEDQDLDEDTKKSLSDMVIFLESLVVDLINSL